MVPPDPPQSDAPASGGVSTGVPRTPSETLPPPASGPTRSRTASFFGVDGSGRTFLRRWGFPLFVLLIVILGRKVLP